MKKTTTFSPREEDELLDIVDEHDQVIGQKLRSAVYEQRLHNFRAVNAFIINSSGKLWIPRRTATKKLKPLALDMSVAGCVKSGETYNEAFARELFEEVNLSTHNITFARLGKLTPANHRTSAFVMVYEIKSDESPNYNRNDFIEYYWFSPQELIDRINAGEPAKTDLSTVVKLFYSRKLN